MRKQRMVPARLANMGGGEWLVARGFPQGPCQGSQTVHITILTTVLPERAGNERELLTGQWFGVKEKCNYCSRTTARTTARSRRDRHLGATLPKELGKTEKARSYTCMLIQQWMQACTPP